MASFLIEKIKDYVNGNSDASRIAHEYLFVDTAKGDYGVLSFQSIAEYLCLDIDKWRDRIKEAKENGKKIRIYNKRFNFV